MNSCRHLIRDREDILYRHANSLRDGARLTSGRLPLPGDDATQTGLVNVRASRNSSLG